jgi:hypothetical protein
MTKLLFAFKNFANAPKKVIIIYGVPPLALRDRTVYCLRIFYNISSFRTINKPVCSCNLFVQSTCKPEMKKFHKKISRLSAF